MERERDRERMKAWILLAFDGEDKMTMNDDAQEEEGIGLVED